MGQDPGEGTPRGPWEATKPNPGAGKSSSRQLKEGKNLIKNIIWGAAQAKKMVVHGPWWGTEAFGLSGPAPPLTCWPQETNVGSRCDSEGGSHPVCPDASTLVAAAVGALPAAQPSSGHLWKKVQAPQAEYPSGRLCRSHNLS